MGNQLNPEHADDAAPRIYQSLDGFSVRLLLDPHNFSMIRSVAVDHVIRWSFNYVVSVNDDVLRETVARLSRPFVRWLN